LRFDQVRSRVGLDWLWGWFDRLKGRAGVAGRHGWLGYRGTGVAGRFYRNGVRFGSFLVSQTPPFLATRLRGFDLSLFLVAALTPETLLDLFDGQQIDGGSREMTGAAGQKGDLLILNIEGEPTATQWSNMDGVPRPPPQLAAAMTEYHELVVEFDYDLEFGRGFTIQLDASVELCVFSVSLGL
jgi:hypothetical protein